MDDGRVWSESFILLEEWKAVPLYATSKVLLGVLLTGLYKRQHNFSAGKKP